MEGAKRILKKGELEDYQSQAREMLKLYPSYPFVSVGANDLLAIIHELKVLRNKVNRPRRTDG